MVEIVVSIVFYDFYSKKWVYENYGVKEYIVWCIIDWEIDWFVLVNGKYECLSFDDNGLMVS